MKFLSRQRFTLFLCLITIIVLPLLVINVQKKQQLKQQAATTGPTLERVEQITTNAFGDGNTYVPMGWGYMKTRIVRTDSDDIIVPYLAPGHNWVIMHRDPSTNTWQQVAQGSGGTEPPNILKGANNTVHVFVWPGDSGTLEDEKSTDNGKTFTAVQIPGQWVNQQGYSGAGTNTNGDMVVLQSNNDQPYQFWWSYYSNQNNQWTFHTDNPSQGYGYPFIFPGNNSFVITAQRDMHSAALGCSNPGGFDYFFNELHYFYYNNIANPSLQGISVKEEPCSSLSSHIGTYLVDSYLDANGIMHMLYNDTVSGGDRISLIQNNTVIKDVAVNVSVPIETRMVQDSAGKFYLITIDNNSMLIYPASSSDTDGTTFDAPVTFDLQNHPGCTDYDFCLPPTMTVPRSGNAPSDVVDGIYGNLNQVNYFRVRLRSGTVSTPTPTITPNPTGSGGLGTPTPTVPTGTGTSFSVTICPHGFASCGDNANPSSKGNTTPQHPQKPVTITLLNASNQPVGSGQGTVSYVSSSGNFQGTISVASLAAGQYIITEHMDGFLTKQVPGIITITQGQQAVTLPSITLTVGDVNNDNQLDILDYNIIIGCFGSKATTASCTNKTASDINDDGVTDGVDYNLFLRELSVQKAS